MNKKILSYAILPAIALAIIGAGTASANGFGFFGGSNATPQEVAQRQTTMFEHQADVLGMSVDDVKNAWAQGKTMQQLASEKGISEDQLKQKMTDAKQQQMKDHLQNLVSQGVITQAQADQRLQTMQQHMQNGDQQKGDHMNGKSGKGFGGHGFGHGM